MSKTKVAKSQNGARSQSDELPDIDGLIIDKSHISHKGMRKMHFNAHRSAQCLRDGDIDEAERLSEVVDRFCAHMVQAIPDAWWSAEAPDGITVDDENFLDYVTETAYEAIVLRLFPEMGAAGN